MSRTAGTYALVFHASEARSLRVGALGRVELEPGYLVYVGSAFGPGGLAGRLAHHCRPLRSVRWHVDWLRAAATLVELWTCEADRRLEHRWAETLRGLADAREPRRGFGSSDCRCPSHLYALAGPAALARARRALAPLRRSLPEGWHRP